MATSDHDQILGVELHIDAGRLWLDWRQSGLKIGFAEWVDGSWSEMTTVPLINRSWAGEQQARRSVRELLLLR